MTRARLTNGNGACIDDAVTAYLVDQLPEVGKVCHQAPQTFAGTARG